ncbi:MAG: A24 family peptidase [Candidatus Uhrbacteria bacterium]|nr:A24 family peptidase [Candidatus Uhrbacteria bacterium]MDP3793212.1 A24 family peptidase [Candidatus Uhrbacteria bacterium]
MNYEISNLILTLLLFAAVIFDIRRHRIPNVLTFGGMVVGLILNFEQGLIGLAVATIIAGIFWNMRAIGGGDHKLLMAVGAFVGYPMIVRVLIVVALAGGVQAIIWTVVYRIRSTTPISWCQTLKQTAMPYSLAIAAGTFLTLLLTQGSTF